jgi:hypothetical protein
MATSNVSILTKASQDLVIDLINSANNTTLTGVNILITNPTTVTDASVPNANTKATVTSVKGGGYIGQVDIEYARLDIGKLFEKISVNLDLGNTVPSKPADLLGVLNAKYGLNIATTEVKDGTINTSGAQPWNATIQIADASVAYTGSLSVTIGPDPEVGERLDTVILTKNLSGLMYPDGSTDGNNRIQAREYCWNVDANSISSWLELRAVGDKITDNSLATELNKVVAEIWVYDGTNPTDYNTANWEVTYTGTNDQTPNSSGNYPPGGPWNAKFNRIVTFKIDTTLNTNVSGTFCLGYNVT